MIKRRLQVNVEPQSKHLYEFEKIGCGRRNRTFIFWFKARRVAGYTIPQEVTEFRGTGIRTQNLALIWR
jgi:hypothetical protein